jgi:hypothetical protein
MVYSTTFPIRKLACCICKLLLLSVIMGTRSLMFNDAIYFYTPPPHIIGPSKFFNCCHCRSLIIWLIFFIVSKHRTENSKQILPGMKLRGLVPDRSQIHECGNWERGPAVSFCEYLFRIFGSVHLKWMFLNFLQALTYWSHHTICHKVEVMYYNNFHCCICKNLYSLIFHPSSSLYISILVANLEFVQISGSLLRWSPEVKILFDDMSKTLFIAVFHILDKYSISHLSDAFLCIHVC